MNIRFLFAALVCALALGSCGGNARTELFNGKDLAGWVCVVDSLGDVPAGEVFTVRDGNIRIAGQPSATSVPRGSTAITGSHAEWRWIGEATNSGIFQRVPGGRQGLAPRDRMPAHGRACGRPGAARGCKGRRDRTGGEISGKGTDRAMPAARSRQASGTRPRSSAGATG